MCAKFYIGDDDIYTRVVQNETDLDWLEEIVDGHDNRVRLQNAKHRCDKLRAILQPQRHAVTGLHAEFGLEMRGEFLRLRLEFGVGNFAFAVKDCGFVRVFLRTVGESDGEVHTQNLSGAAAHWQAGIDGTPSTVAAFIVLN
jgi:hypothetical protein